MDSESRLRTTATGIRAAEAKDASADAGEGAQAPTGQATDPKCGMTVDARAAAAAGNTLTDHGVTYYFCSPGCKAEFEKHPERYAASNRGSASRD